MWEKTLNCETHVEYGWLAKVHRWVLSCAWSLAVPMLNRSFNSLHATIKEKVTHSNSESHD